MAILAFYLLFYRMVVSRWGRVVHALLSPLHLERRHPARAVEAVGKLAAAGIAQLGFAVVLMVALGVSASTIVEFRPGLVVMGAIVGVGEIALASAISSIAMQSVIAAAPSRRLAVADWLARARGGWMSFFLATTRAAPWWLAATSIALYVVVEELVFRGIMITALAGYGPIVAITVSAALFVAVQPFSMPSARAALFPMIGAAVVGPLHGVLFWHVHDILPLVVAHLTYFLSALRFAMRDPSRALLSRAR